MSKTNDTLDAMLKQYENNSKPTNSNSSTTFDEKNYFTTYLPDKVDSLTKIIRILPTSDGTSPFVELFGHQAMVDGKKKTLVCIKNTKGLACPFCEAREALLATGKEADKELAKRYSSRKMYAPKIIDRSDEGHGPKFWRFNHDYRKQGILDKIFGILQAVKKDISDPLIGRDLQITIARDQNKYPFVQSIIPLDASPLSEDAALAKTWLADTKTWESVYSVKPYEYLAIVVKGGTPEFNKETKEWVDKGSNSGDETKKLDEELSIGVANVKSNVTASTPVAPQQIEGDDDLPF